MKKGTLFVWLLVMVFGMTVVGCELGSSTNSSDPTYSVRTAIMLYADFEAMVRVEAQEPGFRLNNGQWTAFEFSADFYSYDRFISIYNSSPLMLAKNQNNWKKDQIIDYFVGRGFDSYMANQVASLVVTTDHILVASRPSGSNVFLLAK